MRNLRTLTVLATTAALTIAGGSGALAQGIVDESMEIAPVAEIVVDAGVVDEGVVDEGVVDGGVAVDDGGTMPVDETVVDEEVVLADRDLDGPISPTERDPGELENPDVIFYTMGGAEDFGSGAADQAAELAAEQASDRALERISVAAPVPASLTPTLKN